jgi:thiol-disulfide isomerase/thioredoxin
MFRYTLATVLLALATSSLARESAPEPADTPSGPAADQPKGPSDDVESLLKAFHGGDRRASFDAAFKFEGQLDRGGPEAEAAARRVLGRKADLVPEPSVANRVDEVAGRDTPVLAAGWLLEIAKARQTVRSYGRGRVVIGRLVVEGGRTDPEMVLAQMPILAGGYFAGEVGDLVRPIAFRAHGYQNLDVPLEGKRGDVVDVGTVTLKPLPRDQEASLRGTVTLDNPRESGSTTVHLNIAVGPVNTPHNGYSPRRRWPEAIEVPVSKWGEFVAKGLSPARYNLSVTEKGHIASRTSVDLASGQELAAGTIRLRCADLGFYIDKPVPKVGALTWEKDYPTALEKARAEGRPLMVMMTATWCGPCRMLENETLADPWIRHFLSGFVLVKAYEDREVERAYGLGGYPTLVFTDSGGSAAHKTVGYKPTLPFAGKCVKAYRKLAREMPADLKLLVDREVIPSRD